ncbi:unnamed protein product [Trypanosoma congolense IL3000]|uniref:WGS project CAEQ00000000 data, annotated contig 661 n=1 Tax=Trypanosoma congolense (strain IL3000) TaxID=1068625 RepID=F9WHK2_TRYCI|nr:unnamed protein product [Trypanosoma congolense IL3000]
MSDPRGGYSNAHDHRVEPDNYHCPSPTESFEDIEVGDGDGISTVTPAPATETETAPEPAPVPGVTPTVFPVPVPAFSSAVGPHESTTAPHIRNIECEEMQCISKIVVVENKGDDEKDGGAAQRKKEDERWDKSIKHALNPAVLLADITTQITQLEQELKDVSYLSFLHGALLVLLVTSGSVMQIVSINYLIKSYPKGTLASFTSLVFVSVMQSLFFFIVLIVYIITRRPYLSFARSFWNIYQLLRIGCMDAFTAAINIYGSSSTPLVLQVLTIGCVPLFSLIFMKLLIQDPRSVFSPLLLLSLILALGSTLMASVYELGAVASKVEKRVWWTAAYFFLAPFTGLMHTLQAMFMFKFTYMPAYNDMYKPFCLNGVLPPEIELRFRTVRPEQPRLGEVQTEDKKEKDGEGGEEREGAEETTKAVEKNNEQGEEGEPPLPPEFRLPLEAKICLKQGDDLAVKLLMCTVSSLVKVIVAGIFFPLESMSFWSGSTKSMGKVWLYFRSGTECLTVCEGTLSAFMLYSLGSLFATIGATYLDQYSVILRSYVYQVGLPLSALVLLVSPVWNTKEGVTAWYFDLISLVLIGLAGFAYVLWETKTQEVRREFEREKKKEIIRLQRS